MATKEGKMNNMKETDDLLKDVRELCDIGVGNFIEEEIMSATDKRKRELEEQLEQLKTI